MAETGKKNRRRYTRGKTAGTTITETKPSSSAPIVREKPDTASADKPSETEMLIAQIMQTADSVHLDAVSQEEAMRIASDITAQLRLLGPDAYSAMKQEDFNLLANLMSKLLGKGRRRMAG
jgi:hypothetical protein